MRCLVVRSVSVEALREVGFDRGWWIGDAIKYGPAKGWYGFKDGVFYMLWCRAIDAIDPDPVMPCAEPRLPERWVVNYLAGRETVNA